MVAVVFTKSTCRYCAEVKQTLANHSIEIYEIRLDEGSEAERAEILELFLRTTSATTVPVSTNSATRLRPGYSPKTSTAMH